MDLFAPTASSATIDDNTPLAERLRPKRLADVIGHEVLTSEKSWLTVALQKGQLTPILLWGPPGVGKTTIARAIAGEVEAEFATLSAVDAGVKEVRAFIREAARRRRLGRRNILFIDEIHRFNKSQQDALLHAVEDGTIVLIGATTENPSFEVIPALLSRCQVLRLEALEAEDLEKILNRALASDIQLQKLQIDIEDKQLLFSLAAGDARQLLNIIERALPMAYRGQGKYQISRALVKEVAMTSHAYDKSGDYHYDTISAFIKSVRGSDPDAALFWLARMLAAGEDVKFIARRLLILASEDVGNAEPYALSLATAAFQAVSVLGMPEARIILGQVTSYLASMPKSNSAYLAIDAAMAVAKEKQQVTVPLHLRNTPTRLSREMGYGKGYQYPHDHAQHFVTANYFPPEVDVQRFYEPGDLGREKNIQERLKALWPDRHDR
jgi:putative ATPase